MIIHNINIFNLSLFYPIFVLFVQNLKVKPHKYSRFRSFAISKISSNFAFFDESLTGKDENRHFISILSIKNQKQSFLFYVYH